MYFRTILLALAVLKTQCTLAYSGIWESCYDPQVIQFGDSYTGLTNNPDWWLTAYCYKEDRTVDYAQIELGFCLVNDFGTLIVRFSCPVFNLN